jgi:hypothetical protein
MSTPSPSPTTVDVVASAWWPWLTEVVIPMLGVAASTAVAVVAIVLANRDRLRANAAETRADRSEVAAMYRAWVDDRRSPVGGGPSADEIRIAGGRLPDTRRIVDWLLEAYDDALNSTRPPGPGWKIVHTPDWFFGVAHDRIDAWERTGKFDFATVVPPRPES